MLRQAQPLALALVKDPDQLKFSQLEVLHALCRSNSVPYRCWQLQEGLRGLYRLAVYPCWGGITI